MRGYSWVSVLAMGLVGLGGMSACRGGAARAGGAESVSAEVREAIRQGLAAQRDGIAELLREPDATLEKVAVPSPPFKSAQVYRLQKFTPTRPVLYFLGYLGAKKAVLPLTARPENFNEMARLDGVTVGDAKAAEALARFFFQTTRPTGTRNLLVESVDQIPYRPNLEGAEAKVRDESKSALRAQLSPLRATAQGEEFLVTGFAVEKMTLVSLAFKVTRAGAVTLSTTPLRTDLPLVFVN